MATLNETINKLENALIYEVRDNGQAWFIKKEFSNTDEAEFISNFIINHISSNYVTLMNLDLQYKLFADVINALIDLEDPDDFDDLIVDIAPVYTNELIDLLKDNYFRSRVDDEIVECRINNGLTSIIQMVYTETCMEIAELLINEIQDKFEIDN